MQTNRSRALFESALAVLAGGVDSPVRAFRAVGGHPLFIDHGAGSRIYDVDGNAFVDYVCSWGPLILGHAHPTVIAAITQAATRGTSFGAPTELETILAKKVVAAYPSIEKLRFVNSGTEATMSAIRLARGYTQREKIIKFDGCYHGHADGLLAKAGSGALTFGIPDSSGVPVSAAQNTLTCPFNDLPALGQLLDANRGEVAAVIVEPVAGNMGVVLPEPGFLGGLRTLTAAHGTLLIFDEVITGFRVAYGGMQALCGVRPDLTCLGKIIGGGLPVGAYGGRADIMAAVAPEGSVYQAGTLSGNPLAMSAGIATLSELQKPGTYDRLESAAARLATGLSEAARRADVPVYGTRVGAMMTTFFTDQPVRDYASARRADTARYSLFFQAMLDNGVYLAPSQFEAAFISLAHTSADIDQTISAAEVAFKAAR